MYYVTLVGRNYNIAVKVNSSLGGIGATFQSRLEVCNGPLVPIACDVDIAYYYEDEEFTSGYGSTTLLSGQTSVTEVPTGVALTTLYITSLTGSGCTAYNQIYDCPGPLPVPTTTTTTTTSTTTTTTTVSPASYSDPIIKHDQYSSSLGAITVSVWENVGTGGTTYKMFKSTLANANAGGSGTALFLGLTGSSVEELYIDSALYGSFINLYDKSFSYSAVFRVESLTSGYTIAGAGATNQPNGFGISGGSDIFGSYIKPYMNKPGSDFYGPLIRISNTPKWYLGVLTFDKTAGSSDAAKFYLNLSKTDFTGLNAIPTPSTFFTSDTYVYNLGITLNPIKLAAAAFWENTVLTQAQIQALYNEYNSRYTLG
jgi:hypothetical protein